MAENDPNLERLLDAVDRLGPLAEEIVLVGGCVTGLLVNDPGAAPIRPTIDVDLLVDVVQYPEYLGFEQRLRRLGFEQRPGEDVPICRWWHGDARLDFMPVGDFLGFTNPWYPSAMRSAVEMDLPSGAKLRHVDAPHFLATKLAAYASRGEGDPVTSHDVEDVVLVLDGRLGIEDELSAAPKEIRAAVAVGLHGLLEDRYFVEALEGYFDRAVAAERSALTLARLKRLAAAT